MKRRKACKVFVCFLCASFLLLTSGFSKMTAEAKEKEVPIGEMVSKGDVRFEARESVEECGAILLSYFSWDKDQDGKGCGHRFNGQQQPG